MESSLCEGALLQEELSFDIILEVEEYLVRHRNRPGYHGCTCAGLSVFALMAAIVSFFDI